MSFSPTRVCPVAILVTLSLQGALAGAESSKVAPEDYRVAAMGDTVEFGDGHSITVSQYKPDFRFEATFMGMPTSGVAEAVWVKICAGGSDLETFVSPQYFGLLRPVRSGGFETWGSVWVPFESSVFPLEPLLGGTIPESLPAGTCAEGWVVFTRLEASPDEVTFAGRTAVSFDSTLVGFLPEELELKIAWAIE